MKLIAERMAAVRVKEFEAAHMINLEQAGEFNAWLEEYLYRCVVPT